MNTTDQAIIEPPVTPPIPRSPDQPCQVNAFLGFMWTAIACAGAGVWLVYEQALFLQVVASLGIIMTGLTRYRASGFTWRHLPVDRALSARNVSWRAQLCR